MRRLLARLRALAAEWARMTKVTPAEFRYVQPAQGCGCGEDHSRPERYDELFEQHADFHAISKQIHRARNRKAVIQDELNWLEVLDLRRRHGRQFPEAPVEKEEEVWTAEAYERRLVNTFEAMAKLDNVEVSEVVGAFIAGYFADRIERAEQS